MMSLFDGEEIMKSYIRSERYDAGRESAKRLIKKGKINIGEVREYFPELLEEDIKELEAEVMQLA